MVLNSINQPVVNYQDKNKNKLFVSTFTSGGWSSEVIADADTCLTLPVAIDSNDNLYLSFLGIDGGLWYVTRYNNEWAPPIEIDPGARAGILSDIAVDSKGGSHIAYCDPGIPALKYAKIDHGESVIYEVDKTVCNQEILGMAPSITVNPEGDEVHISYYDPINKDIKYALFRDGSLYPVETVDSLGEVGLWNSIALDSNGLPRIAYMDNSNKSLKIAWATLIP
jgi:hypothetical protein